MQLAAGLLADLDLNKPPPKDSPHMMLNYDARGCPRNFNPVARTIEQRRAAIACYSFNSTYCHRTFSVMYRELISIRISIYFQKLEPPRWTFYLEECVQKLAQNEECQTDRLLACLVQLQLINDKTAQAPWYDRSTELLTPRAPAIFYLKALETQLQDFKSAVPQDLLQNGMPCRSPSPLLAAITF